MSPEISDIQIPESEYSLTAVRSSGPGGQHVNKVSSAILLRFDISSSSLAEDVKQRLLAMRDNRITDDGVILIKSSISRSQARNKEDALLRLKEMIQKALRKPKLRKPTTPDRSAIEKRLEEKTRRGERKEQRKKPTL